MSDAHGFPERSWLLDREELFELYRPDREQLFPPGVGIRVNPRNPAAEGYREFVLLEEGLAVIASEVRFKEQVTFEHPDRPIIKFHYRLTGGGGLDFDERGSARVAEHMGGVLYMPTPLKKREIAFAGKHEQSVTVACSPAWLAAQLRGDIARAPREIAAYARGESGEFFYLPVAMRAGVSQAAQAMLSCELQGQPRRMVFHARALEMLALTLEVLAAEASRPEHAEHRISKADYEQLREARHILQTDFAAAMRVADLAARVGMNESRLMQLFKRLYGETVFDFSQRVRMEFAAKLLEATERSITEIAFEVGYDYPSNFTTAFKRHFGVPPRSLRHRAGSERV